MVAIDPSLAIPFKALKDAVQDGQALSGLLDVEGLPNTMKAEEYITYMVRRSHTLRMFRAPLLVVETYTRRVGDGGRLT